MKKNDLYQLVVIVVLCCALFLCLDAISILLASLIVYFKVGVFSFEWENIITSFFTTGYVGGIVLGLGIWIKSMLQNRKNE
ncbi:hypothetical protein FH968_23215 [Buttiauxella sp. B2]|uniref:hypothetical protein n=1 Tax=Buttiauxella sp. B2 TaxID=2587812 RepID=UPI00111E3C76|nr:hypothetical protein [Buttiauxella sp. B2]TNV09783.1 hypothetical protein FH968_23215 [Buttiauxella sp. B2]